MDNEKNIDEIIKFIATEKVHGYGKYPLPCQTDYDLSKLINIFIELLPFEREKFRKRFTSVEHLDILRAFSYRMSILAVRERNERWILEGLVAHAIEDFRYDYRENMRDICLLNNSTSKIGADPIKLFNKAAEYANLKVADLFREYARMPNKDKRIELMGYEEVVRKDGFWYHDFLHKEKT